MLDAYDSLNIKDSWIIERQGVCVVELLDIINPKLKRLVTSKTRLSCRNVLVANFETMTKAAHWLKSKLFVDLPEALGKTLREKILQMVDLLKALMVKIIDVDEFAKEFFERLKSIYLKKKHTSDYELWKARQSKITIKRLVRYQVDLTADMLSSGILKYVEAPNGEEIQDVDKDKLALKLTDKSKITEAFINECAKLRRYSHWEGDRFVIDYHLIRKYLYCIFGKLSSHQHIKMFEYDIQMKQIHEDIERLRKEKGLIEEKTEKEKKLKEERFHFIHPEIEDEEAWRIHNAIKRLVVYQKVPEICAYMKEQKLKGKVMLPSISSVMYSELVRMGMPTGDGYTEKHFTNYYMK
jgi:hypothetical protein